MFVGEALVDTLGASQLAQGVVSKTCFSSPFTRFGPMLPANVPEKSRFGTPPSRTCFFLDSMQDCGSQSAGQAHASSREALLEV